MLMFEQHPGFRRFVSFVVLMSFGPISVDYWNFLPQFVVTRAEAEAATSAEDTTIDSQPAGSPRFESTRLAAAETPAAPAPPPAIVAKSAPAAAESKAAPPAATVVAQAPPAAAPASPRQDAPTEWAASEEVFSRGDKPKAFREYMFFVDRYKERGVPEARTAMQRMKVCVDTATPEELAAMEAQLPTEAELSTASGKFLLPQFYYRRAARLQSQDEAAFRRDMDTANALAWKVAGEFPNSGESLVLINDILGKAEKMGAEEEAQVAEGLRQHISKSDNSISAWWSRLALGRWANKNNRSDEANRLFGAVREGWKSGVFKPFTDSTLLPVEQRVVVEYVLAMGAYIGGHPEEALPQCEQVQTRYADFVKSGAAEQEWVLNAGLLAARIVAERDAADPYEGILAYSDFMKRYPKSIRTGRALLEIGALYLLGGDYGQAAEYFRQAVQEAPGSEEAKVAERELDFVLRNLYGAVEVAENGLAPQLEQWCGPLALHKLLALQGTPSSPAELARMAQTDAEGTTMLGLVQAAEQSGLKLVGVHAATLAEVPCPFIAYVNGNHFVVVREVREDAVAVSDMGRRETFIAPAQFAKTWDGKALVADNAVQLAKLLDLDTLKGAKGGCFPGGKKPPKREECTTCPCKHSSDGNGNADNGFGCGGTGGAKGGSGGNRGGGGRRAGGMGRGGNASGGASAGLPGDVMSAGGSHVSSCPARNTQAQCSGPGCPGSPTVTTGISGPGMHPIINALDTALDLNENDLSFDVQGSLKLTFGRIYSNRQGYPLQEYTTDNEPGSNHIGKGWTHPLNMHVRGDFGIRAPLTLYDQTGHGRSYEWANDMDSGTAVYTRAADGGEDEIATRIEKNVVAGWLDFYDSNGTVYHFTIIGNYARVNRIVDAGGKALDFAYDASSRLTTVSQNGTAEYLQLSYSSYLITKVELRTSSSVLNQTEYAYDSDSRLTRVTDRDGKTVQYAYGAYPGWKDSQYITSITDKAGQAVTLAWTYAQNTDGIYEANKIVMTNADGLSMSFERSLISGACVITAMNGTTLLLKRALTPWTASDPSRVRYQDHYINATTFERWTYEYDAQGNMIRELAPGSIEAGLFTYTSNGRLSTARYYGGPVTSWHYAAGGTEPTRATDTAGLDSYFYYAANRALTKVVTPTSGSNGWQYERTVGGLLTRVTDPLGQATTFGHDALGRRTSTTNALGVTTGVEYDALGRVTRSIDARNKSTYYHYSGSGCGCGPSGQLTKVTNPLNQDTQLRYDAAGNRTKVIDALGHDTDYAFDDMNRMIGITSPSGSTNVSTLAYDLLGRMTAATGFDGKTIYYAYDHVGRSTRITDAVGSLTTVYDALGRMSTITDSANHTTAYAYDATSQLTRVTYANGKVTRYFYDSAGQATKTGAGTNGDIDPTQYYYDGTTGVLTQTRFTTGSTNHDAFYAYDTLDRLTRVTDWLDGTNGLRYAYDSGSRLTTLTDYDNATLTYAYDNAGAVTSMTDYHGNTTTYTYTDTGQLSTLTAPGSRTWDYDYNALGQPVQVTLPNGMWSYYGYDARNRLVQIFHVRDLFDAALRLDYDLDAGGNITRVEEYEGVGIALDPIRFWTYGYDGRGRLTNAVRKDEDESIAATYAYTYDAGDNMLSKSEPFLDDFEDGNYTGWSATAGWSASGGVMAETNSAWTNFSRGNTDKDFDLRFRYSTSDTAGGRYGNVYLRYVNANTILFLQMVTTGINLVKYEGGNYTTLASNSAATSSANAWYNLRVLCDGTNVTVWRSTGNGGMEQVLSVTNAPFTSTTTFGFISGANSAFSYDDIQVVGSSLANSVTSFGYNAGNELTSQTQGGVTTSLTYDAWGRMTSKTRGSYSATYAWGQGHKLTGVTSNFPGEGSVTYAYGGDGKRRTRNDGTVTKYRWDRGWNAINEEDSTGALALTLVGDQADISGSNPAMGTIRYTLRDNLGSLRALYGSDKTLLGSDEYTPYGEDYLQSGATATRKFTGLDWDSGSKLYFTPYRYYSPNMAHWLSRDPLGLTAGPNVYEYVSSRPNSLRDPLGLFADTNDYLWSALWEGISHPLGGSNPCNRQINEVLDAFGNYILGAVTMVSSCLSCGAGIFTGCGGILGCGAVVIACLSCLGSAFWMDSAASTVEDAVEGYKQCKCKNKK